MALEILKSGLASSVQDQGREGFGSFGVPQCGAMDKYAAKFANILVGNAENDAVLEIATMGCKIRFHERALVAISGLDAEIYVNKAKKPINEAFLMARNDILEIKGKFRGRWVYVAISGGILSEIVLKSRSMYEGITPQFNLKKGTFLEINPYLEEENPTFSSLRFEDTRYSCEEMEVFPGPEFQLLSQETKRRLIQCKFTVSGDSSRMAFLFEETVENKLTPILTSPVLPGSVQLTSSGKLIVLMRDCQVTGGYPRVLQVTEKSVSVLSQKRTGEEVGFRLNHFNK